MRSTDFYHSEFFRDLLAFSSFLKRVHKPYLSKNKTQEKSCVLPRTRGPKLKVAKWKERMWKEWSLGVHYLTEIIIIFFNVISWVKEWIWESDAGYSWLNILSTVLSTSLIFIHTIWFWFYHVKQTSKNQMPHRSAKITRIVRMKFKNHLEKFDFF